MDYRKFDETREKLCKELEKQMDKELSAGTLSTMHQLAGTMHYIDELIKADEEDEYSERGSERSYRDGYRSYRGGRSYDDGRSYEDGRSMRRGRGADGRYVSRGDYSRGGDFAMEVERLMADAPDEATKQAMRQMLNTMR